MPDLDRSIPDFSLPATGGKTFRLAEARGRPLVLYFYPKDNTPGCATEAAQFRDLHTAFSRLGGQILGISRDSLKSHENFRTRLELPFDLLSDSEEVACTLFDVIKEKKLYGKPVRGIERSTFLIDDVGILRQEWRGIRADGHAAEVLRALQSIQTSLRDSR